jgi:hypothetical protein
MEMMSLQKILTVSYVPGGREMSNKFVFHIQRIV